MSTKSVKSLVAVCIVAVVAIAAYWYWSPFIAMKQMQMAAESKDADAFNERVDYPKLRESFKGQFSAMMADNLSSAGPSGNGFAAMGTVIGMALGNQMIDGMVRPETIMRAIQEGKLSQKTKSNDGNQGASGSTTAQKEKKDWSFERKGTDKLIAYAVDPDKLDAKNQERFGLVFLRNGFADWKLSEVRLPLSK